MTQGFYSLVQYCPDASRAEAANVGLMIFQTAPAATAVRVVDDVRSVLKRLGQKEEAATLLSIVQSMRNRIEREQFSSIEQVEHFVRTRGNQIQLTMPRPMRIGVIDRELDEMFDELVETRSLAVAAAGRQVPFLQRTFMDLERRLPARVSIRPEFHVPRLGISFQADYSYTNGQLHVVQEMPRLSESDVAKNVFAFSKESELVHKLDGGGQLVVVSTMASRHRKLVEREREFGAMLGKLSDAEFVPSAKVEQFAKKVERELAEHS